MTLKDKLETHAFVVGVELVSTRGTMSEKRAIQAKDFSRELTHQSDIDWVSITDNAGGNPMLSPEALGTPILFGGREVMIHLSCKDFNRHGLESRAWALASHGFHNILALSGDYPVSDIGGMAKPVFDLDSIGLLGLLTRMNRGLEIQSRDLKRRQLLPTQFFMGAVTTNYKLDEQSVVPQYLKLEKKVHCGAQFVINQIGYDARKMHEQIVYLHQRHLGHIPLIGNVFVLNDQVARLFHDQRIPGVVVSDPLLTVCEKQAKSQDKGKAFFLELAAKQVAIYRGLGYRGVYLGGVHRWDDVAHVLALANRFATDDWLSFVKDLQFSRPGEFFLYPEECKTGLSDVTSQQGVVHRPLAFWDGCRYRFFKWVHSVAFVRGKRLARLAEWVCRRFSKRVPHVVYLLERMSKSVLFECCDCGDCSLHEVAFLCPESQCVKNQRNGPCGGSRDLLCEVRDVVCVWSRAYVRRKGDGQESDLLTHVPVLQDQALRGTSSWVNAWLGRDHQARAPHGLS